MMMTGHDRSDHIRIRILGPLSVIKGTTEIAPTAPKQRQVLALLLLNANRVVTMPQMVWELWSYHPPATAVGAVHIYVMQLRRSLGAFSSARLTTHEHGYRMVVRAGELDFDVFSARVRNAQVALTRDKPMIASQQLHAALDLWRADVLVDVDAGPILATAVERIEQRRLEVVHERIRVDLRLGLHHELLGELSGLVHGHPADEQLVGHLMLALYRSGRQAGAIGAFQTLRTTLAEEHGVPPSNPLRQLYGDILSADRRLELVPPLATRLSLDLVALR
jgi:SARP family transcriptional regulator, regulator of embCAB operon